MKGLQVPEYLIAFIISNALAILLLVLSLKQLKTARMLFFVLFVWACIANWSMALTKPEDYLFYGNLTFLSIYKSFIYGWFSNHIQLMVGFIATCQALIAVSFLLKGWIYKMGTLGAILFLLAIAPLGVGSAFPCTVILSVALYILLKEKPDYVWHRQSHERAMTAY